MSLAGAVHIELPEDIAHQTVSPGVLAVMYCRHVMGAGPPGYGGRHDGSEYACMVAHFAKVLRTSFTHQRQRQNGPNTFKGPLHKPDQ